MLQNNTLKFSTNKLSEKSKTNFKRRFVFSIAIVAYLVLSLVFFLLADKRNNWVNNDICNNFFGWFILIWIMPIIVLAAKEIRDIHFKKNIPAFIITLVSISLLIYIPTFIYFIPLYTAASMSTNNQTFWFLISTLICVIFIAIINVIYLWSQGLFNMKQLFVHGIMILLVGFFFLSFLFFGLIKGWTTILILYLITALTDTFAYLVGMLFGRKKLSPHISPNKTIAGFIGGICLSTLTCIILLFVFSYIPSQYNILGNFFGVKFKYSNDFINANNEYASFPLWWLCVFFILLGLSFASVIGDLSFSYIKRKYGIKDFSNLIPGHGGMLDRIDSLTFVFSIFLILVCMISLFSSTSPLI